MGKRGSSSRNYDVLGRELMTPDEVRKLDNKKCIVLIRGCDPVIDFKFNTFKHPMFKKAVTEKESGTPTIPGRKAAWIS